LANADFSFATHYYLPRYPNSALTTKRVQQSFHDFLFKIRTDFIKENAPFIGVITLPNCKELREMLFDLPLFRYDG
jgi:hypothetical protein